MIQAPAVATTKGFYMGKTKWIKSVKIKQAHMQLMSQLLLSLQSDVTFFSHDSTISSQLLPTSSRTKFPRLPGGPKQISLSLLN